MTTRELRQCYRYILKNYGTEAASKYIKTMIRNKRDLLAYAYIKNRRKTLTRG